MLTFLRKTTVFPSTALALALTLAAPVRALAQGVPVEPPPAQPTPAAPAPAPAPAPDPSAEIPIAVLTIQTLDAFEQADALTIALKNAVDKSDGWAPAQLPKDYALFVLINSLGCTDPPDAACEQKIADEIKVDRFIWGQLRKEGTNVVGQLHLWVRDKGSKATSFQYSANLDTAADVDLATLIEGKFKEIVGAPPGAQVRLKAGTVDGVVFVDGQEAGKMKSGVAIVELAPGPHRILVKASGYQDMEASVELKAREQREVSLIPLAVTEGVPIQKIFGFTALGLGVAAAGVATYAGVRVLQINDELEPYRTGQSASWVFADGKDGCDPAGDYDNLNQTGADIADDDEKTRVTELCAEGRTLETMTLGLWPVAGALAGTGIILLATANWSGDKKENSARLPWILVPNFGAEGGDITFAMRF